METGWEQWVIGLEKTRLQRDLRAFSVLKGATRDLEGNFLQRQMVIGQGENV